MAYTPEKPPLPEPLDQVRRRVPGWGADLDPKDRPSYPREVMQPTGAHWHFPDRQPEHVPRERSIEHKFLTPVFGTAAPLKGVSGLIRRWAYARHSEAQAAHWLLLIAADRVDVLESNLASLFTLHPDNPITETGILAEPRSHPITSRFGQGRADVKHQWIDPIIVAAPYVIGVGLAYAGVRALTRDR
jgi:hypothetical protein